MTTKSTPSKTAVAAGTELELGFNDLLSNGQAVGRNAGLVIFCFGPLPQERARVRIVQVKQRYAVAELIALTLRSPFRAQPFCPVFGACGGCQVQHLNYPAQLGWKRDVVSNALRRIGGFPDPPVRDPVGMINPRNYRNKMALVVEHEGSVPSFGFYKMRSHEVVPISACPVVQPQLNDHLGRLNEAVAQPALASAFAQSRHLVERAAKTSQESVLTITTAEPSAPAAASAAMLMRLLPGLLGVTNSYDSPSENAILGRKMRVLAGDSQIEEQIAGVRYRVSAGSFFQVNVEMVARIFEFMRPGLSVPREVVDLYCGVGTFSLFFAKMGSRVLGIEENAHAVAEARDNAALNGFEGSLNFVVGRVEDAVRRAEVRAALASAQIAFLDPPRKGSDPVTLEAITASGVPNVWYLSCDPATLARDLKFLAAKGYRLGVVQPFDMFPHTGHIETLVTLYRESALQQQIIDQAFRDVPAPQWPQEKEYPDFVVR